MAYLGKGLDGITTANIVVDTMTGDGSTNTMGISLGTKQTGSANNCSVFVSGVCQRPGQDYSLAGNTITFTTAPINGAVVCVISKGPSWKDHIAGSSVYAESFKDGAVTNAKLIGLSSSKLTGALPALDGSALTGITPIGKYTSDPAIDTNPSGGIGTLWLNKTTGNMYVCTDATADANVWTNIGGGSGDVFPISYNYVGDRGIVAGGYTGSYSNSIEYWSTPTQGDGITFGNLQVASIEHSGSSGGGRGLVMGGYRLGPSTELNKIDYVTIATLGDSTTFGNLTTDASSTGAVCNNDRAVRAGGYTGSTKQNVMDYVTIATTGNALDFGDLLGAKDCIAGSNHYSRGIFWGGNDGSDTNDMEYITIDTKGNAQSFGIMTVSKRNRTCNVNETRATGAGGHPVNNTIDYVTILTEGNADDFGDLEIDVVAPTNGNCGNLTTGVVASGYTSGTYRTHLQSFTIATTGNASTFGNLQTARYSQAGFSG